MSRIETISYQFYKVTDTNPGGCLLRDRCTPTDAVAKIAIKQMMTKMNVCTEIKNNHEWNMFNTTSMHILQIHNQLIFRTAANPYIQTTLTYLLLSCMIFFVFITDFTASYSRVIFPVNNKQILVQVRICRRTGARVYWGICASLGLYVSTSLRQYLGYNTDCIKSYTISADAVTPFVTMSW